MENFPTYYDFLRKIMPVFGNFGTFPKEVFSIKVFHNLEKFPLWAMENHVDNVEKQAKSRVFSKKIIFCLWKTFKKILSSLFLKKIIFHVLHKSTNSDKRKKQKISFLSCNFEGSVVQ